VVAESRLDGVKPGDEVVTRVPFERGGAYAEYMIAGNGEVVPKSRGPYFSAGRRRVRWLVCRANGQDSGRDRYRPGQWIIFSLFMVDT